MNALATSILASAPALTTGSILRLTRATETHVLAMAIAVALAVAVMLVRPPELERLRRGFILLAIGWAGGLAVLGATRFNVLLGVCEEYQLVERLGAFALLAAAGAGALPAIRLHRLGRPPPMLVLMAAGCLWGFLRELEFGAPFFGRKILYTRNFFRLRAYIDPAYFEKFNRSLGHVQPRPLFVMHWIGVAVSVVCIAAVVGYLVRHRNVFDKEIRRFTAATHGRWFLLGLAVFAGSQLVEKLLVMLLRSDWLIDYYRRYHLSERVLAEPVETLAALAMLVAMIAAWRTDATRPAAETIEPAE